jgi:hypothetical protein
MLLREPARLVEGFVIVTFAGPRGRVELLADPNGHSGSVFFFCGSRLACYFESLSIADPAVESEFLAFIRGILAGAPPEPFFDWLAEPWPQVAGAYAEIVSGS